VYRICQAQLKQHALVASCARSAASPSLCSSTCCQGGHAAANGARFVCLYVRCLLRSAIVCFAYGHVLAVVWQLASPLSVLQWQTTASSWRALFEAPPVLCDLQVVYELSVVTCNLDSLETSQWLCEHGSRAAAGPSPCGAVLRVCSCWWQLYYLSSKGL
jgi:hypothetical protein